MPVRRGYVYRGTEIPVPSGALLAGSLFVLASGLADAAPAAEFSLRLEHQSKSLTSVAVTLAVPCTSWSCGVELLEGRWREGGRDSRRFEFPVSSEGVVRGQSGDGHGSLWVVVETGDGLPWALLWRPPGASGDLPPLTLSPKSSCSIRVTNERDEPVAGAWVAPVLSPLPSEHQPPARQLSSVPTVFAEWTPWLPPRRTDAKGRTEFATPAGGTVAFRVRANGHRSAAGECQEGAVVHLRLERSTTRRFRVENAVDRALAAALARDRLGMPLALSDADGRIDLDPWELSHTPSSRSLTDAPSLGPPWFETADGRVYAMWRRSGDVLSLRELTSPSHGTVRFEHDTERDSLTTPENILAWREPVWPWPTSDSRVGTPLLKFDTPDYVTIGLPGDRLWFVASGFGHAACPATVAPSIVGEAPDCPVLKPSPPVEGIVVDQSGLPLSHTEIHVSWPSFGGARTPSIVPPASLYQGSAVIRSDEDGSFRGRHIPLASSRFGSERRIHVDRPPYLPIRGERLDEYRQEGARFQIELTAGTLLSGRVVEAATGLPVADAEVGLGRFSRRRRSTVLGPLEVETGAYGEQVRVTRTNKNGLFNLNTWPGAHDLVVRAPNHAFLLRSNLNVPTTGLDLGNIYIAKEREILGVIEDSFGAPVPGAVVWAAGATATGSLDEPRTDAGPRSGLAVRLTADQRGQFRVSGLTDSSMIDLEVSAPRFATRRLLGLEPKLRAPIRIRLEPEAVIAGRVTWRGDGVQARLEVQKPTGDPLLLSTDTAGHFRTSGLAPGRYDVLALPGGSQTITRAPTFRPSGRTPVTSSHHVNPVQAPTEAARMPVEAIGGETTVIELELQDGNRRLAGVVVEFGTGLPGVEVRAGGKRTTTDGRGEYLISGLGSGLVGVTAERRSDTLSSREGRDRQEKLVDLASEATRLDFDFSMYAVSGHALWADSAPAGVVDLLFSRLEDGIPFAVSRTTSADGYFELDLLPGQYRVQTRVDGTVVETRDVLRVRSDESAVRLRFRRNLTIHGVVTGLTGEQIGTLQVEALSREMGVRRAEPATAPSGDFSIAGLDSGAWTVVGRLGNSTRLAVRQVRLDDQDVRIELEFRPLPTLGGRVLLDGQPFQGMNVFLSTTRNLVSARRVWTGHDGSYRFPDVEPGDYILTAGASSRTISLTNDMELPLEFSSGAIDGWIVPQTGRSWTDMQVRVWPSVATLQEAEILSLVRTSHIDDSGRFGFGSLPEGEWMLDVEGVPRQRRVTVSAGSAVQVQLQE